MEDLFLKIIRGEIPSAKVYEDEHIYAFLDIRPVQKGHTLVIPKTRYRNIFDIDSAALSKVMSGVQRIARALAKGLQADGVTIVMNNEPAGGQEVFHAHIHVIPRFTDDGAFTPPHHTSYAPGEIEAVARRVENAVV
jgi:histidine triad (HIT) family protein